MSKVEKIVKELTKCVEFKKLRDIVEFTNGKGHEKVVEENGKYILITSKAISTNMEQVRKTNKILTPLNKDDITMVMSDLPNGRALAKCFIIDEEEKYTLNQRVCSLKVKEPNKIIPKFLYYVLNRNPQLLKYDNGVDQTNLKKDDILNISVSIPPLEAQKDIVRILDELTLKSENLNQSLNKELVLRKKQYDYYKDILFSFDNNIEKRTFEELCHLSAGGDINKDNVKKERTEEYTIPVLSNGIGKNALYGYTNTSKITAPCITISGRGTIGYSELRTEDFYPIVRLICVKPKTDVIDIEYLNHYIKTIKFKIPTTGIPQLTVPMIKKYKIPIPSMEEQKRIVMILNKFDKIITDISDTLLTEIDKRQKQFEYYRDELLSFKGVEVNE